MFYSFKAATAPRVKPIPGVQYSSLHAVWCGIAVNSAIARTVAPPISDGAMSMASAWLRVMTLAPLA